MTGCSITDCSVNHIETGYYGQHYKSIDNQRAYNVWAAMKARCTNPRSKDYDNYGGRGITVYDEWLTDFNAFYEHIGKRPTTKHSLDRINNNGNYEPGNVRWATKVVQQGNRRSNKSGTPGVSWDNSHNKWEVRFRGKYLGRFKNKMDAVRAREKAVQFYS